MLADSYGQYVCRYLMPTQSRVYHAHETGISFPYIIVAALTAIESDNFHVIFFQEINISQ